MCGSSVPKPNTCIASPLLRGLPTPSLRYRCRTVDTTSTHQSSMAKAAGLSRAHTFSVTHTHSLSLFLSLAGSLSLSLSRLNDLPPLCVRIERSGAHGWHLFGASAAGSPPLASDDDDGSLHGRQPRESEIPVRVGGRNTPVTFRV